MFFRLVHLTHATYKTIADQIIETHTSQFANNFAYLLSIFPWLSHLSIIGDKLAVQPIRVSPGRPHRRHHQLIHLLKYHEN
jgi:hypothetical protein